MEARISTERHVQRQQKLKEQVDTRVAAAIEKKGILIVFTGNGRRVIDCRVWDCDARGGGHGKTAGVAQQHQGAMGQRRTTTFPRPLGVVEFQIIR